MPVHGPEHNSSHNKAKHGGKVVNKARHGGRLRLTKKDKERLADKG